MTNILWRLGAEEEAPAMAEYSLLLVLIALVVSASVVNLGDGMSTFFAAAGSAFAGATIPTIP